MTLTLHIDPTPGNEGVVRNSAESALRDAESWGSVASWRWGSGADDGQATTEPRTSTVDDNALERAVSRLRSEVADALETVATTIRGDD